MAAGKVLLYRCAYLCVLLAIPLLLPAQSAAPLTGFRDPRAIAIAQQVIAASGGSQAWLAIHSIHSEWAGDYSSSGGSQKLVSDDSWAAGLKTFTHTANSGSGVSTFSAGSNHTITAQSADSALQAVPVSVQTNYLPLYAPAAALSLEAADTSYGFEYVGVDGSAVRIRTSRLMANGSKDLSTIQDWVVDSASGLPTAVTYRDLTIQHSSLVMHTLCYSDYHPEGTLVVPTTLYFNWDTNHPLTLTALSAQ